MELDGIRPLYDDLFATLRGMGSHTERARRFMDCMSVHCRLHHLKEVGLEPGRGRRKRTNANYLRIVRGWSF